MALLRDEAVPDKEELEKLPPLVTPGGEEIAGEETARWKERAELYLIENIPFGTVTVLVPRNSRDPETFALGRARELIGGLGQPEYLEVRDFANPEKEIKDWHRDLEVELHFHGQYHK